MKKSLKLLDNKITHVKELLLRSEQASKENLALAKDSIDGRLSKLNELREDFSKQQNLFTTKSETENMKEAFNLRMLAIERSQSASGGAKDVSKSVIAWIGVVAGAVITGIIMSMIK